MERYDAKRRRTRPLTKEEREGTSDEEYYQTILGIQGSGNTTAPGSRVLDMNTRMGLKSPVLDHAYEFAVKQYELMHNHQHKHNDDPNGPTRMTEEESIALVERMLEDDRQKEAMEVRSRTNDITQWKTTTPTQPPTVSKPRGGADTSNTSETNLSPPPSAIPSMLTSKPRTIRALAIWGKRLAAVPYHRWTLGATTALDHWIAVDVLGMEESNWDALLDGTGDDPGHGRIDVTKFDVGQCRDGDIRRCQ